MGPSTSYLWRLAGEAVALIFRAAPGYEARLTQHASLILTGEAVADLNCAVIDVGPHAEDRLREFSRVIQERTLPIIMFLTDGVADQLAPIARNLGLQHAGQLPLMTYRPHHVHAESGDYQVDRVESELSLRESNEIAASAFGLPLEAVDHAFGPTLLDGPGLDIFVARQGDNAISTVTTTCAGPTVGIWIMATAPEHQRKGAGRALLEHVIAHHYERGARLFYLLATEAGKPLYERVGFRMIVESAIWVAGHSTQVAGHERETRTPQTNK